MLHGRFLTPVSIFKDEWLWALGYDLIVRTVLYGRRVGGMAFLVSVQPKGKVPEVELQSDGIFCDRSKQIEVEEKEIVERKFTTRTLTGTDTDIAFVLSPSTVASLLESAVCSVSRPRSLSTVVHSLLIDNIVSSNNHCCGYQRSIETETETIDPRFPKLVGKPHFFAAFGPVQLILLLRFGETRKLIQL